MAICKKKGSADRHQRGVDDRKRIVSKSAKYGSSTSKYDRTVAVEKNSRTKWCNSSVVKLHADRDPCIRVEVERVARYGIDFSCVAETVLESLNSVRIAVSEHPEVVQVQVPASVGRHDESDCT